MLLSFFGRSNSVSDIMENKDPASPGEAPPCCSFLRAVGLITGDMRLFGEWVKICPTVLVVQLLDWVLRGVAQVMLLNNPISGLLIVGGLFLQNPWWALNALIGTFISTVSALLLGQNRGAVSAGLHGYSGTLVGMLMAVVSAKGSWYWWLLLPNVFMSMLCPVVSSALSSLLGKWDLPILTLPFNILLFVHVAATGGHHPYFPQALAAPHQDIYSGLWGYNSVLSCIAIGGGGGVFYVLTWQTHLLAVFCALFCAYMNAAVCNVLSVLALPAASWSFSLSTLIFLLMSSEIRAICRVPPSAVSRPEEETRRQRKEKSERKNTKAADLTPSVYV
nr:urea transporter 1-like [Pseudochaenichthys georgianus]